MTTGGKLRRVVHPPDVMTETFEAATFPGWRGSDGTLSQTANPRTGSAGTKALRLTDTGAILFPCAWYDGAQVVPGSWYSLDVWACKRNSGNSATSDVRSTAATLVNAGTPIGSTNGAFTVDTWKRCITTMHMGPNERTVSLHLFGSTTASTQYMDFDDLTFTRLSLASLLGSLTSATATVSASARVTLKPSTTAIGVIGQAGVAVNVDSATAPRNLVVAYVNSDAENASPRVVVEKCVDGVWTVLKSATVAYVPGGAVQIIRSASNSFSAYYNGAIVDSATTISDASIISNTLHGTFNTDSNLSVTDLSVVDSGTALIFDRRVAANADDGRWSEFDSVFGTGGAIIFGYGATAQKQTNGFMRFTSVAVPKNATISTARLDLYARSTISATTVNANICAVLAANPAAPTTYAGAETATRTTAVVAWANAPAMTISTRYSSPSIATVIQELVNQATWATGNAMVIYAEDNGSTATQFTYRTIVPYDDNLRAQDANLHIEFTP